MKLTVVKTPPAQYGGDMAVYFVRQGKEGAPLCADSGVSAMVEQAFAAGDFLGKEGQTLLYYPAPAGDKSPLPRRVLVVGLGREALDREGVRKAGGTVAATALKTKAAELLLVVPEVEGLAVDQVSEYLVEGVILGSYQFRKYKAEKEEDKPGRIDAVALGGGRKTAAVRRGMKRGRIAAMAACAARDMANEPGNHWTPGHFAEYGRKLAEQYGFTHKTLDRAAMKRLGMGGILGVNQGSDQPPKMVVLEYRTGKKVPTLLLVGKGLTFDSGGISLKAGAGMDEMKYDMCGGAAVLAAMAAVGEERPGRLDVVAIVPATENLPGPGALKPGDIIRQYGGKTVEVLNTDAEGRLILADALAYGIEKYRPAAVVDLATLTGAVIVSLGHHRSGLLGNDQQLVEKLLAAGDRSGEPLWQLPLAPEYSKQMESKVADLKNVDKRDGGTITAAAFLKEFVGDTPWAHLDIAGTAWNYTEKSYVPKGPSGIGVRLLLELIRNWR